MDYNDETPRKRKVSKTHTHTYLIMRIYSNGEPFDIQAIRRHAIRDGFLYQTIDLRKWSDIVAILSARI